MPHPDLNAVVARVEAKMRLGYGGTFADVRAIIAALREAREDGARLDWLDANAFTAYRDRDPATQDLSDHAVVVDEDAPSRRGCIGTIRAAIDAARAEAPDAAS